MPVPKTNFSKGDADAFCEKRWGKNKRCLDKWNQDLLVQAANGPYRR
jgi:hypothetical protein